MHVHSFNCFRTSANIFLVAVGIGVAAWALDTFSVAARAGQREAPESPTTQPVRLFTVTRAETRATILKLDRAYLAAVRARSESFVVEQFPLSPDRRVSLELKPFQVVGADTQIVIGNKGGADRSFDYDWNRISFFHGRVKGKPGSHAFLALGDGRSTGVVDLGRGLPRYRISSKDSTGALLAADQVSVFATGDVSQGGPAGVPFCGIDGDRMLFRGSWVDQPKMEISTIAAGSGGGSTVFLKHMELAIETDYELFQLFDDATEAMDYVVTVYGEVSATFMRDVDMWIDVVFVRIWDQPDDLFNGPDPLRELRPFWTFNMTAVQRDSAQLFSGRRDYPFGGQAYLGSLCSNSIGYGIVGYAAGILPDPTRPDPYTWDVRVTAHELGHTCGAPHTHGIGVDTCDDPLTTPQRGSIMSYCSQTWSGMSANADQYFHRLIQTSMDAHITASQSCIPADCNMNGLDDLSEIAGGGSLDINGNSVPDECEDCNGNGVLDPMDISEGGFLDTNSNGVPDTCETDCNGNDVPDSQDIDTLFSLDAYGNYIPDECEADCNNDEVSDYTEIQADMTLDKDRNAILDSCQDCDGDGMTDFDELGGAHGLWVGSGLASSILREFHANVGVLMSSSSGATVGGTQDLIIVGSGPTARILASNLGGASVMEFDAAGVFQRDFVPAGAGVIAPAGLLMTDAGVLLVADQGDNKVLAFDGTSGMPLGAFIANGAGGLTGPFGITFGPNGLLYVTSSTNEVMVYDGSTGAFLRVLVSAADNGGLDQPRGLAFKPDGNLLVASFGTDEVLEFDGMTGRSRGKWAKVGTDTRITQDSPWGIRVGPNGHVYVTRTGPIDSEQTVPAGVAASHLTDARMFEYNVCTGNFRKTHIGGNDHGLNFATGFDFIDGFAVDCNQNQIQDSCDIDSAFSADVDLNGVPDECQVDCNGNGVYDHLDIWPNGTSMDCNCNFVPDECDINAVSQDCNANGRPDECEVHFDCNGNSIQDICDVFSGASTDIDANGVLDECETPGLGVLLDVDFENGLPAGWTTSGIFNVTGACSQTPACDGSSWAYAGNAGACIYGDGNAGGLKSPPIELPLGNATLDFCYALDTELGFDFADVSVNNVRMMRLSGSSGGWVNASIDLRQFEGRNITIVFKFQSDTFDSGTLGWQVDNIRITTACDGVVCDSFDAGCAVGVCDPVDGTCLCETIPTTSDWGMVIMSLMLASAGSIVFGRRRRSDVYA